MCGHAFPAYFAEIRTFCGVVYPRKGGDLVPVSKILWWRRVGVPACPGIDGQRRRLIGTVAVQVRSTKHSFRATKSFACAAPFGLFACATKLGGSELPA